MTGKELNELARDLYRAAEKYAFAEDHEKDVARRELESAARAYGVSSERETGMTLSVIE